MASKRDPFDSLKPGQFRDLGFGETLARDAELRLLNRDGTFNAHRHGLPLARSIPIYEHLTTMTWGKFYSTAFFSYVVCVTVFAFVFLLLGPEAVEGDSAGSLPGRFAESFFLSVHTVTTVGYGSLYPSTLASNIAVGVEALLGLAGFALFSALMFARLSRPYANIRFSEQAVVAPYREQSALMFRIANNSRGELEEASVRVIFSHIVGDGEARRREFETLSLERSHLVFFPMHWTAVHPIGEDSPLQGWDAKRLLEARVEFLIQVTATAETYGVPVRTRASYIADEVVWNARFTNILEVQESGQARVDIRRLDEFERLSA
ncbi:MAG: ion channel [Gemmatimonadota bacterium]|nr:ion channel [Gemmatimonadota bacterium]